MDRMYTPDQKIPPSEEGSPPSTEKYFEDPRWSWLVSILVSVASLLSRDPDKARIAQGLLVSALLIALDKLRHWSQTPFRSAKLEARFPDPLSRVRLALKYGKWVAAAILAVAFGWLDYQLMPSTPLPAEVNNWEARPKDDDACKFLRSHLELYPNGIRAAEAERLLAARTSWLAIDWVKAERKLPVRAQGLISTSLPLAQRNASDAANEMARQICQAYAQGEFRLDAVHFDSDAPACQSLSVGSMCVVTGTARCDVEVQSPRVVEKCQ
jgi:hypothetical protein